MHNYTYAKYYRQREEKKGSSTQSKVWHNTSYVHVVIITCLIFSDLLLIPLNYVKYEKVVVCLSKMIVYTAHNITYR